MTDVWKPTPSQVISRLIIGLIRVKSLIFVAGKAAVGNLPDLTNSPGITENIRETGLFNVACANELFPGRIIWHYIWKDTLFPDEVIFLLFQIFFLSDSYQVIMYCQVKFWKVNKCTKFSISWFYFWPQAQIRSISVRHFGKFCYFIRIRYLKLQRNLIEFWLENLKHFEESHFESY